MNQYDTPLSAFDLRNVASQTKESFELIPAGQYLAAVVQSEIRTSRNGTDYVFVRFALMTPQYSNRALAAFFFLWTENNAKALANYRGLREACGLNPDFGGDTNEFLHKQVVLYVDSKTNNRNGEQENYIKFYTRPRGQSGQPVQPMPNFVQPPAQPAPAPQPQTTYRPAAQPSEQQMGNINEVPF